MLDVDYSGKIDVDEFCVVRIVWLLLPLKLYNVSAGVPDKAEEKEGQLALVCWLHVFHNFSIQKEIFQNSRHWCNSFSEKTVKVCWMQRNFTSTWLFKITIIFRFIANLQDEILEVEFSLNSTNGKTLSPLKFSEVILEHTKLHKVQYNEFLTRLNRLPADIEVSYPLK